MATHKYKINLEWNTKAAERFQISCKKGCEHCCRQLVTASLFEGVIIADHIRENGLKDVFRTVLEHEKLQRELRAKHGMSREDGVEAQVDPERIDKVTGEWFNTDTPCPFLANEECTIYPIRPTSCATCCVVSNPILCRPPSGNRVGYIDNANNTAYTIHLDSVFLERVYNLDENTWSMPMPLPMAVSAGMEMLIKGPASLEDRFTDTVLKKEDTNGDLEDGGVPEKH